MEDTEQGISDGEVTFTRPHVSLKTHPPVAVFTPAGHTGPWFSGTWRCYWSRVNFKTLELQDGQKENYDTDTHACFLIDYQSRFRHQWWMQNTAQTVPPYRCSQKSNPSSEHATSMKQRSSRHFQEPHGPTPHLKGNKKATWVLGDPMWSPIKMVLRSVWLFAQEGGIYCGALCCSTTSC